MNIIYIVACDIGVIYTSLFVILEVQKKAVRYKRIPIEEETADQFQELRDKTGVTSTDLLSNALAIMKKEIMKNQYNNNGKEKER